MYEMYVHAQNNELTLFWAENWSKIQSSKNMAPIYTKCSMFIQYKSGAIPSHMNWFYIDRRVASRNTCIFVFVPLNEILSQFLAQKISTHLCAWRCFLHLFHCVLILSLSFRIHIFSCTKKNTCMFTLFWTGQQNHLLRVSSQRIIMPRFFFNFFLAKFTISKRFVCSFALLFRLILYVSLWSLVFLF